MHVSNHFKFCYDYLDTVFHKVFTLEVVLQTESVILFFHTCRRNCIFETLGFTFPFFLNS